MSEELSEERNKLHRLMAEPYTLEDMAFELESIAGSVTILASVIEPAARPEGNPSAETIDQGFDSIVHHLMRLADHCNALQRMVNERNKKQKEGSH